MVVYMNKQKITDQLKVFGLDEIESGIYLNLLEGGDKTPLDLSRETGINRSRIYRYLDRLKQKKLIEESNVGRGLKLKAANPESLEMVVAEQETIVKEQREELPRLVETLTSIPRVLKNDLEIKYFHGREGLKQMLWNQLSANKEILLYGYQTRNEIVGKVFADKVRAEQIKRRITLYEIENDVDPGSYKYTSTPSWGKYYVPRLVPQSLIEIKHYTAIFNNTVSIMHWIDGQQVGVEIVNSQYAAMQRQLFWAVWEKVAKQVRQPDLIKESE